MKKMDEQVIILIERKGRKQFTRFIELFKNRAEIPIKEVRAKISKSSYYDFVLNRIYDLNEAIRNIDPMLEPFIAPTLNNHNGKIIQTFKRNCEIEITDDDPNFFHIRLKSSRCPDGQN